VDEPSLTEEEHDALNQEMEAFYQWWMESGFVPLSFSDGLPAIELKLEAVVEEGIVLTTRLDCALIDEHDQVWIIDWKTGSTKTSQVFVDHADQLTFMQICLEPYLESLGISQVDKLGIVDIHGPGKKKPASVEGPVWAHRRSAVQVSDLLRKVKAIAGRIEREEFFMSSRYGFNCPCSMCEYAALCKSAKNLDEYVLQDPGVSLPAGLEDTP